MTFRWLTALLVAFFASVLTAAPALAHAALIGSDPTDGAQLDAPPARVTLTFNQDIEPRFAAVTVSGPDGTVYADGDVRIEGPTASVAVKPLGAAARYVVAYRVISADGHPISGQLTFTLTATPPATPPTAAAGPATSTVPAAQADATAPADGGFPAWIAVVAAVAVLGGLVLVMVRRSRG